MKTKYDIHGALYINKSGNLVDRNNKPVSLNCYLIEIPLTGESVISRNHFEFLQNEQNVEAICLTIHALGTNGYCTLNEAEQKELRILVDTAVRAATELSLYIIIKWCARDISIDIETTTPEYAPPSLPDGGPTADFFHRTAKRYQAYGNVLYEIREQADMTTCATAIIPIIRECDSYAVILHHTKDATAAPLKGYNIGYAPSLYDNELNVQKNNL